MLKRKASRANPLQYDAARPDAYSQPPLNNRNVRRRLVSPQLDFDMQYQSLPIAGTSHHDEEEDVDMDMDMDPESQSPQLPSTSSASLPNTAYQSTPQVQVSTNHYLSIIFFLNS